MFKKSFLIYFYYYIFSYFLKDTYVCFKMRNSPLDDSKNKLTETQRQDIRKSLFACRHSKLHYNRSGATLTDLQVNNICILFI